MHNRALLYWLKQKQNILQCLTVLDWLKNWYQRFLVCRFSLILYLYIFSHCNRMSQGEEIDSSSAFFQNPNQNEQRHEGKLNKEMNPDLLYQYLEDEKFSCRKPFTDKASIDMHYSPPISKYVVGIILFSFSFPFFWLFCDMLQFCGKLKCLKIERTLNQSQRC